MAIWTISRTALDNPATGTGQANLNDKAAFPLLGATNTSDNTLIDVVENFQWTYSPRTSKTAFGEVPYVRLREKRLLTNALIAQLKYSLGKIEDTAPGVASTIAQYASRTNISIFKAIGASVGAVTSTIGGVAGLVSNAFLPGDDNPTIATSPYLAPYRNLYISRDTGWRYRLPYFEDSLENVQNMFSTSGPTNALGALLQPAVDASMFTAEAFSTFATVNAPFSITYIERSKFFNYSDDGEDISVSFPLINTGSSTFTDVINNWQLLYLLMYQNRPGKTSINTVEQPVIYELEIPGVKFFPFAYISSMSVNFVGARRRLSLQIPYSEVQTTVDTRNANNTDVTQQLTYYAVDTIVPDAYFVKITFHGMNTTTRNFMMHMLARPQIVTASENTGLTAP